VVKVPDTGFEPVHPPDATQDVVFADDHDNTDAALYAIDAGLAEIAIVGRGITTAATFVDVTA